VTVVDRAIEFAIRYQHKQVNQHNGEPYLLHCQRVARSVRHAGPVAEATGWLHDVVEDTDVTLGELLASFADYPQIVKAVSLLTHAENEPYSDYIKGMLDDGLACIVKLADIQDNFRRNHLIEDDATRLRMAKKYSSALDMLSSPRSSDG
jgi:(p)ppGpp synthase/HD superfamily hydrolase